MSSLTASQMNWQSYCEIANFPLDIFSTLIILSLAFYLRGGKNEDSTLWQKPRVQAYDEHDEPV
jgi:hypothetical protein